MKLSPETRQLFLRNADMSCDSEDIYFCQDILEALTDDKGQALNKLDVPVVGILSKAIQTYHEGAVSHD